MLKILPIFTGRSLSEALLLASINPQYDDKLFIELQVQYMKIPSSEHVENMLCTQIGFCFDIQNNLLWVSWCENKCFWQRFTCKSRVFHDKYFLALRSYTTWLMMVVKNPKCPDMFRQAWIMKLILTIHNFFFSLSLSCFYQCRCLHGNDVFLHQNHIIIGNFSWKKNSLKIDFTNIWKKQFADSYLEISWKHDVV